MAQKVIIGLLLIVIGWLLYDEFFRPEPPEPPKISQAHEAIQSERAKIDSLSCQVERLTHKMASDSLENLEALKRFKIKISGLTQKLAEKRPEIQPLLDSLPKLAEFVLLQDSVIDVQATRIDSLTSQKERQWKDFNKLLDLERDKFQAATEINLHLEAINDHWREENRKLRKHNRLLKIGVGVAFVSGVMLAR